MKMNYVSKIQLKIKTELISTAKITTRLVDGSYKSIYKGRSMNFDELREYIVGDDLKDVDWKASARSQKLLVKQYIAEKKHNFLFVMDTNKRMLADTEYCEEKREVGILSAGTLACIVNKSGDYVSSIYATEKSIEFVNFSNGLMNIENILQKYNKAVTEKNESEIEKVLQYVVRNIRRRMIVVLVTDLKGLGSVKDSTMKQLLVQNDVMVFNIDDASIQSILEYENKSGSKFKRTGIYNVNKAGYVPAFLAGNTKLQKLQYEKMKQLQKDCDDKLKKFGIASVNIKSSRGISKDIIGLLRKHNVTFHM